jgi:hypothetical protein
MQARDATNSTILIALLLLLVQVLSCGHTSPNRKAVEGIAPQHPLVQAVQGMATPSSGPSKGAALVTSITLANPASGQRPTPQRAIEAPLADQQPLVVLLPEEH